ncbi:MAG: hypothetical protein AMXMBFR13_16910 [Phycisphaerae bacterium]|jgi:hypothetical protein
MTRAIKTTATVLEGGRVEVVAPELLPGANVEVIVLQEDPAQLPSINEVLRDYPGGRLFKTAEEVDAYIREERDSWDR